MSSVDLVSKDVRKHNLAQVPGAAPHQYYAQPARAWDSLLLLSPVEVPICNNEHATSISSVRARIGPAQWLTLELLPDVGHLLVDSLLLELSHTARTEVGDVLLRSTVISSRLGALHLVDYAE